MPAWPYPPYGLRRPASPSLVMRRSGKIKLFKHLTATFDRLPIRVRLAGVSALLTFVILCGFAVAVGSLTVRRIRSDFNREVADTAQQLPSQLSIKVNPSTFQIVGINPPLQDLAEPEHSAVMPTSAIELRQMCRAIGMLRSSRGRQSVR